jgi:Ca-activated chloride channel family protein
MCSQTHLSTSPLLHRRKPAPSAPTLVAYRLVYWWLLASSLCALTLFTIATAEASAAKHNSGHMTLHDDLGTIAEALLVDTAVEMNINGMVATVTYHQQFRNTSDAWVEGRYVFPLPETAAVNGMTLRIGERVIVGEIREKQAAQKIYQQARDAGQRASLVKQQRPNLFSQQIANIGPGERIDVTLSYRQTVDFEHGHFSLRLPLTITPRYIPAGVATDNSIDNFANNSPDNLPNNLPNNAVDAVDAEPQSLAFNTQGWGWSPPTTQVSDAHLITPPMNDQKTRVNGTIRNPVSIAIELTAGLPLARIDSLYHEVVIHKQDQQHSIRLSADSVAMDRDFVLTWQPVSQHMPRAALFTEHVELSRLDNPAGADSTSASSTGEDYVLLMLLPPQGSVTNHDAPTSDAHTLPREVTFIVDTSGSMAGTSLQQAKASLHLALATLSERDYFNIVEFNSSFHHYSSGSQPATANNIRRAQEFVARLTATGGTEMYAPLNAVLSAPAPEGLLKQVVFITDGSVGNESALFQLIENKLGDARLFMVGIGSAPNSYFMRKSAQFGRGTFTHVGDLNEVAEKMSALFRQLQSPRLRDIHIHWPDGLAVEAFPQRQPDLYDGQPLLLKAKVLAEYRADVHSGTVTISGQTAQGPWSQSLALVLPKTAAQNGIASLWARDKIAALMDQTHTGTDAADIKPQVVEVALAHQLMSAYTSFVAVDTTPARPMDAQLKSQTAPNLVAQGQTAMPHSLAARQSFSYPQTALGLRGQLWLASLLLLAALLAVSLKGHSLRGHRL